MKFLRKYILTYRFFTTVFILVVALQFIAKFYFGLGYLPVYVTNPHYEYMYAPGQDLYRFGNHIQTNSLGMRSSEIDKKDKVRILKIGDSVINGGAHVDQDNLSSSILAKKLTTELHQQVGLYNVSAQSWGPDNAFAFIKEHGDFNANIFLLVFSSHDLHDNMHFKKVVGNHKAWPDKQPLCALTDAWSRYAWPRLCTAFGAKNEEYDYLFDFDNSKINSGWKDFIEYTTQKKIKLIVYVHPTLAEVENKTYDKYGRQLLRILDSNHVEYVKGVDLIQDKTAYRDMIHLNSVGHKKLADALEPILKTCINNLGLK